LPLDERLVHKIEEIFK